MEANKKSNNWSKNNRKTLKKIHYIITGLNYHISPALMDFFSFFFFLIMDAVHGAWRYCNTRAMLDFGDRKRKPTSHAQK